MDKVQIFVRIQLSQISLAENYYETKPFLKFQTNEFFLKKSLLNTADLYRPKNMSKINSKLITTMSCPGQFRVKAQHNLVTNTSEQLHKERDHRKKIRIIFGKM